MGTRIAHWNKSHLVKGCPHPKAFVSESEVDDCVGVQDQCVVHLHSVMHGPLGNGRLLWQFKGFIALRQDPYTQLKTKRWSAIPQTLNYAHAVKKWIKRLFYKSKQMKKLPAPKSVIFRGRTRWAGCPVRKSRVCPILYNATAFCRGNGKLRAVLEGSNWGRIRARCITARQLVLKLCICLRTWIATHTQVPRV